MTTPMPIAGVRSNKSKSSIRFNPITGKEVPIHPPSYSQQSLDLSNTNCPLDRSANVNSRNALRRDDQQQKQTIGSRTPRQKSSRHPPPPPTAPPVGQDPIFDAKVSAAMKELQLRNNTSRSEDIVEGSAVGRQPPPPPSTLREALNGAQQSATSADTSADDDFETMVAAEMEMLRLEYDISTKGKEEYGNDEETATTDAQPNFLKSQTTCAHSSPIPMSRSDDEVRRERRARAREYGAQLRLQMEQDAAARKCNQLHVENAPAKKAHVTDAGQSEIRDDTSVDSGNSPIDSISSYGEQLRRQMKQDQERRQQRKKADRLDGPGNVPCGNLFERGHITCTSKQQKASEYKRQLDEQIAERARGDPCSSSCTGTKKSTDHSKKDDGCIVELPSESRYEKALEYKRQLDEQIEERRRLSSAATSDMCHDSCASMQPNNGIELAEAQRRKKEYARQLREQMEEDRKKACTNSTMSTCQDSIEDGPAPYKWASEDRGNQERVKRKEAALLHQRMLQDQIEEQRKAREDDAKNEEIAADALDEAFSSLITRCSRPDSKNDIATIAPPQAPATQSKDSDQRGNDVLSTASVSLESAEVPMRPNELHDHAQQTQTNETCLDCKSTFIAVSSSSKPKALSSKSIPVPIKETVTSCSQSPIIRQKPKGAEAFIVQLDEDSKACKATPITRKKKSSRKQRSKGSAKHNVHEPSESIDIGGNSKAAKEDDILVQEMIREAMQTLEQNIPNGNDGHYHNNDGGDFSTYEMNVGSECISQTNNLDDPVPASKESHDDVRSRDVRPRSYYAQQQDELCTGAKHAPFDGYTYAPLPTDTRTEADIKVDTYQMPAINDGEAPMDGQENDYMYADEESDDDAEERLKEALSRIRNIMNQTNE